MNSSMISSTCGIASRRTSSLSSTCDFETVDIDQTNVWNSRHFGMHVARYGDVDDEKRMIGTPRHCGGDAFGRQHEMRCAGRGNGDVGGDAARR